MALAPGFHALWPTPLGVYRYAEADALNPLLVRVFGALRATQSHARGETPGAFFASDDDLLGRVQLPEWQRFVRFVVESLRDTVTRANAAAWPPSWAERGVDLQLRVEGMWFQVANGGAFHDVHTHGNASWSGVYCVQVDAPAVRRAHPVYGVANGVTRFYGPPFAHLGGAHVDLGNAYLQPPHVDVDPVPGQLVLFPAWLAHQALPYAGTLERVIVSFNASVHAAGGSDRLHGYAGN
ncbi:putative 2OG-Fe(II) oxygenase [Azohydromonas sediminis]|uniref:putative 2OG-Fe(II) oxygenase n=1 Tax=Azohydromonas sediminis TaxID=2259674 RepID=UPI000E65B606|nr:putative 2OG-Fe(II) oxygenase [Azohydromonas sediminis]